MTNPRTAWMCGVVALSLVCGCAVPANFRTYCDYRLHDLADVAGFQVGGGIGAYGEVAVRGSAHFSFGATFANTRWYGLADGRVGGLRSHQVILGFPTPQFCGLLVLATASNRGYAGVVIPYAIDALFITKLERTSAGGTEPDEKTVCVLFLFSDEEPELPPVRWLDLSAELSCLGRVKATFSPGEALDFVLGIFTIDISGDDAERSWRIELPEDRARIVDQFFRAACCDQTLTLRGLFELDRDLIKVRASSRGSSYRIDRNGQTALAEAAKGGNTESVRVLLELGADVNAKSRYDETPLHVARRKDQYDLAALLLKHGANVNAGNEGGRTPLHNANMKFAELLISKGADVNARNAEGETPLHCAARGNADDVAEFLISHGAHVNAKNANGDTPLRVAIRCRYERVAEVLRKHGAVGNK